MIRAQTLGSIDALYADLWRQLGLTDAQVKEFREIMLEQQRDTMEDVLKANGEQAVIDKSSVAHRQIAESKIQELIGHDGYLKYHEYRGSVSSRFRVNTLASRVELTEAPFTSQQKQLMLSILEDERKRFPHPLRTSEMTQAEFESLSQQWQDNYNRNVSDLASYILDDQQLMIFRWIQDQRRL